MEGVVRFGSVLKVELLGLGEPLDEVECGVVPGVGGPEHRWVPVL